MIAVYILLIISAFATGFILGMFNGYGIKEKEIQQDDDSH